MRSTLFLAALAMSSTVLSADAPTRRTLLDGKLTMLVPAEFSLMPDAQRHGKYPGANAPAYVLTNEATTTNIAFDLKPVTIKPEEVPNLEASVAARLATSAKVESHGVRKLNGVDFAVFVFDSTAPDGTIRNVMAMTSLEGRLLAVSFNCMEARNAGCGALGKTLIDSIVLKQ